jgi:hypothetical protein
MRRNRKLIALAAEARRRGSTPEEQLLAISIGSTSGFTATTSKPARSSTYCSSSDLLTQPAQRASSTSRNIRSVVRQLAEEASLSDPDSFARSWHILMTGSIVFAAEGDTNAAQRAKAMARRLIEGHSHSAPAIAGLAERRRESARAPSHPGGSRLGTQGGGCAHPAAALAGVVPVVRDQGGAHQVLAQGVRLLLSG